MTQRITSFFPPAQDVFARRRMELEQEQLLRQRRSASSRNVAFRVVAASDGENAGINAVTTATIIAREESKKRLKKTSSTTTIASSSSSACEPPGAVAERVARRLPSLVEALISRERTGPSHRRGVIHSHAHSSLETYATRLVTAHHHLVNVFAAASSPSVMEFDRLGALVACGMGNGRVMIFDYDEYLESRREAVNSVHAVYGNDTKRRDAKWKSAKSILRNPPAAAMASTRGIDGMVRDVTQKSVGSEQSPHPPVLDFTVPGTTAFAISSLDWNPRDDQQIVVGITRSDAVFVFDLEKKAPGKPSRVLTSYDNGKFSDLESQGHTLVRYVGAESNRILGGGVDGMIKIWDTRLSTPGAVWRAMEMLQPSSASLRRDVRGLVRAG